MGLGVDLLLLGALLLRTVLTHLLGLASERPPSTPPKKVLIALQRVL